MDDKNTNVTKSHKVLLANRKSGAFSGVVDVLSFDVAEILLETELGMLLIKGHDLHVNRLTLEKGEIDIEGRIDSLTYSDIKNTGKQAESILGRIPIVHTAPIPGCETANRNFFVKRHLSVSSKYIAKQITLGKRLLSDTQDPHGNRSLREEMLLAQKENGKPDAAVHIIKTLEKL